METWKPIPGWEDLYEVSDHGNVRSLDRVVIDRNGRSMKYKGKPLKWQNNGKGYPVVGLWQNKQPTFRTVHSLVAEVFIGPRPALHDICHNDGNPWNPVLSNLRYDTRSANHRDKERHGTSIHGQKNPRSKLTDDDVRFIRSADLSVKELAKRFQIATQTVTKIRLGQRWSHVL